MIASVAPKNFSALMGRGPVRVLCDEIGFPFDRRMERADVFVAFVRELVSEVAAQRAMSERLAAALGCDAPSKGSAEVLALAMEMLNGKDATELTARATAVHDAAHRLNPDDAYPTDHLIDMLSSCASAIRFGLEEPCRSRHAASAANHVWKQMYGLQRFDSHTPEWSNLWARSKLIGALLSLLAPSPSPTTEGRRANPESHTEEVS